MSRPPASLRTAPAAVALLAVLAVLSVVRAPTAGAAACGPAPAGSAAVALVVDTGAGEPVVRCVTVRERATGRAVLQAAGIPFRVGSGTPADNNQGGAFLCGILGVPRSGCATVTPQGVDYWVYFRQPAGAKWDPSRVGFDTPIGSRCWVEGWRWTPGGSVNAANNNVPRTAPPAVTCAAAAPTTTAAPVAPSPVPAPTAVPQVAPSTTAVPDPGAPVAPTTTAPNDVEAPATAGARPNPLPLKDLETALIRQAVDDARGNVMQAARALGISRATVYRKLAIRPHKTG